MRLEALISKLVEYHRPSDLSRRVRSLSSKLRCREYLASLKDQLHDREFDAQTLETAIHYLFLQFGPKNAMLECCDLPSLEELLRVEWHETDIDYRTSELEEAVDRVIELSSTPNYTIESPKTLSAREVTHCLGCIEWALGRGRNAQEIGLLLNQNRNGSVWSWVESMLKLFMGYLFLHFTSYLPNEILKSFEGTLNKGPVEPALSSESHSDEYTRLETGLNRLVSQLGAGHPRYLEVLVFQQRLSETIEKSRRYGDTPAHKAERNEISDYLNQIALCELSRSFNELSSSSAISIKQDYSVGQVFQSLDFFFRNGELPGERAKRRGIYQEILENIQDSKERDERCKELEVEENGIRENKKDWVEQLQNECWRDFGRLSPFESVDLAVFSRLTDLYQNPIAHKAIESLLCNLVDGEIREAQTLLKEAKKIVSCLKAEMPRVIVILGTGTDNYGNCVVWFVDRLGNRRPETSECLEWACFSSEIDFEPFQQMAMIPPVTDDTKSKCLIDPVAYPVKQVESFISKFE